MSTSARTTFRLVLIFATILFVVESAPGFSAEETATVAPVKTQAKTLAVKPGEAAATQQEFEEAVKAFSERVQEFTVDIGELVGDQYSRKEKEIDTKYEAEVSKLEAQEADAILSAIEALEKFIALYPSVPEYSPDVMFRLAELYYQKGKKEFDLVREQLLKDYERKLAMFDEGKIDKEPTAPHPDFNRTIELYNRIAANFPDYRYIDAVYYQMAYCYQEEGNLPNVRRALENLIASRPKSQYIAEAYLRIGNAYFDELNYDPALQALLKAAEFEGSTFYDQILYKLASTYFILNRFDDAVATFTRVNDYSEKMKEKQGRHSYYRDESIKYIAFCHAQSSDYWTKTGEHNAEMYFDATGAKPWEADVFRDLGDYFVQQTKWEDAVAAYRRVLTKDPYNPENPELQNKIIDIYIWGLKDEKMQNQERERLVNDYGEGSEWAKRNADNPDALQVAQSLALNSLRQWAIFQHMQAQKYKELGKMDDALVYYKRAADAYRRFLTKFPNDKEAYDLNYNLAEALFFSGDYKSAVAEFTKVRDSKLDNKYFQDSAFAVVLCYDNLIGKKGDQLTATEEETQAQQRERLKGKVEKKEIPELKKKYVEAGDFYVAHATKPQKQEEIAFNSAFILFEFNHLDEARDRFINFVNNFPKSELAPRAARHIIDTYTLVEDWVKVTEWSEKLASLEIGSGEEREKMLAQFKMIKGNAMANYAAELEQRKEYEKAAEQYMKAVGQDAKGKDAPAMLYNAAANYSRAKRPAKAMELFQRMVDEYPDAEFAGESLYYVAENAFDSFQLDQASSAYKNLYTKYADKGLEPKRKCQAIFNHAMLKEFNHEYESAAGIYEKYSNECDSIEPDAPVKLFVAGELYEKLSDWKNMQRIYESFIKKYGQKPENHRFVVQAYFKIGKAYEGRKAGKGDGGPMIKEAVKFYNKALEFFDTHPGLASDALANNLAAQAKFTLVSLEDEKYMTIKIAGRNPKQMKESFDKKQQAMNDMIKLYSEVKRYKSPEYFLATTYKTGEVIVSFADALFDAPVPPELVKFGEDAVLEYQQQLADQARPFYELASKTYLEAFDSGKKAKLFASPWMKRVYQGLNHPNIRGLVGETLHMRKRAKPLFRQRVTSPLPVDNGRPHVPVKPKEEAPAGEQQAAPQPKAN